MTPAAAVSTALALACVVQGTSTPAARPRVHAAITPAARPRAPAAHAHCARSAVIASARIARVSSAPLAFGAEEQQVRAFWVDEYKLSPDSPLLPRLLRLSAQRPTFRDVDAMRTWAAQVGELVPTADLPKILCRNPAFLGQDIETKLEPRVRLLASALPGVDVGRVVTLAPTLLRHSTGSVVPKVGDLKALLPHADVPRMIERVPALLTCDIKRTVLAKLSELRLHVLVKPTGLGGPDELAQKVERDPALLLVGFGALWRLSFLRAATGEPVPVTQLSSVLKASTRTFDAKYPEYRDFLLARLAPGDVCAQVEPKTSEAEVCELVDLKPTAELQALCGDLLRSQWERYTAVDGSGGAVGFGGGGGGARAGGARGAARGAQPRGATDWHDVVEVFFAPEVLGGEVLRVVGSRLRTLAKAERTLKTLSVELGADISELDDLLSAAPSLVNAGDERLRLARAKLHLLREELPGADVLKIVSRAPALATGVATADELRARLHALRTLLPSGERLERIARLAPTLLCVEPARLERKVSEIEALLPGVDARKLVARAPTLLTADVRDTLGAKLDELNALLPGRDVRAIVARCPALLGADVAGSVRAKAAALERLLPGCDVGAVVSAAPTLLLRDVRALEARMLELHSMLHSVHTEAGGAASRGADGADGAARGGGGAPEPPSVDVMVSKAPSLLTADVRCNLEPKLRALHALVLPHERPALASAVSTNPRLLIAGFAAYGRLLYLAHRDTAEGGNGTLPLAQLARALKATCTAFCDANADGAASGVRYAAYIERALGHTARSEPRPFDVTELISAAGGGGATRDDGGAAPHAAAADPIAAAGADEHAAAAEPGTQALLEDVRSALHARVRALEVEHGERLKARARAGEPIVGPSAAEGAAPAAGSRAAREAEREAGAHADAAERDVSAARAPAAAPAAQPPARARAAGSHSHDGLSRRSSAARREALALVLDDSAPAARRLEAARRLSEDDPIVNEMSFVANLVAERARKDVRKVLTADRTARSVYRALTADLFRGAAAPPGAAAQPASKTAPSSPSNQAAPGSADAAAGGGEAAAAPAADD